MKLHKRAFTLALDVEDAQKLERAAVARDCSVRDLMIEALQPFLSDLENAEELVWVTIALNREDLAWAETTWPEDARLLIETVAGDAIMREAGRGKESSYAKAAQGQLV